MLTQKQVKEIREHLDKAQNPVFFFDNDGDGLCSFLLLQRYSGKGKGVPVKSFPDLTSDYFRKVNELNADYIFILDKPVVSKEFFEKVEQSNIPTVWIDHHASENKIPEFVYYYNPLLNESKNGEPVTALCYQVTEKKEDLWIAIVGCISDGFIPSFYADFEKTHHDLTINSTNSLDIYYNSPIGKISNIFNFALMDRITNVINMLKFLIKVKSPYGVLEENNENYLMHKRFNEIQHKFQKLIDKAKKIEDANDKILFFQYAGDMSVSSDLANKLRFLYPNKKMIVVAYMTGIKANISVRGKNIRGLILKAIKGLEDATGGGHPDAIGAKVRIDDLELFRERLEKLTKE